MTATTLTPYDLSKAIIAVLKADSALINTVGTGEIKSDFWNSKEFEYPNIRLDVTNMPVGPTNGNCHGRWFDIAFSVYVHSNEASEKQCSQIMGLVGKLFQNNIISSAALRSQLLDITYIPPVPGGPGFWRGEVVVEGEIIEL